MFSRSNSNDASAARPLPGSSAAIAPNPTNEILQQLAIDYMHDKKVRRRWKIALFVLFAVYLISIMVMTNSGGAAGGLSRPHTALVELSGGIGTEVGVTSDQINESLRSAFKSKFSKGVVLRINSPGGTPVQSAEINEEITRLRALYPNKPIHAVVSDMAASGGYFVAVATDKIYANRSSLVGSIGVRMDGFGFVDALKKLGVERRSLTAGANKAILDPFLPVRPEQKAHAQRQLDQIHQQFIAAVKAGRGDRISNDPEIYSGLFWSGEEAKALGLVDEFGSLDSVARTVIGHEEIVDYTYRPNIFDEFSRQFGVAVGVGIANVVGGQLSLR